MTSSLGFYHDEDSVCDGCGNLRVSGSNTQTPQTESLSACQSCKMARYHNKTCQLRHWKEGGHRHECARRKRSALLLPIQDLINCLNNKESVRIFLRIYIRSLVSLDGQEQRWRTGVYLWKREMYLDGMQYMQDSLDDSFMLEWNQFLSNRPKNTGGSDEKIDFTAGLTLARRMLFLSYCEMDGGQIDSARRKLVACIASTLSIMDFLSGENRRIAEITTDDALHEIMLSFEEDGKKADQLDDYRSWCARQIAHIAVRNNRCGWVDPYQRPGYMVPRVLTIKDNGHCDENVECVAFWDQSRHPHWCRMLEDHWHEIQGECIHLMGRANSMNRAWSQVGGGDRDSGHSDHRVVDNGKWTELVLFGTGETDRAPITRRLVAKHAPDAVSLAREGGGEVILSRLAPGTHIQSHCGPTDLRLTAHLGLLVPKCDEDVGEEATNSCRIRVANKWHAWRQGKMLVFDDSFEHEVLNDTDEERVVLLLRFWHPKLDPMHRATVINQARDRKGGAVEKRYHPPTAKLPCY